MKIKTQYIHHSCYTLEIENYFLVFDYFEGELDIPAYKDVYFFVSHFHADHFSKAIFDYADKVKKYIISNDVKMKHENAIYVGADEKISVDNMNITTYKSTDSGVAFIISINGKNIFFAGDLNDWYWEMEDDLAAKNDMHARFVREIDKIRDVDIDIAYFLVDPRQAGQWALGGEQILELKPKNYLPMHFWGDFGITTRFRDEFSSKYPDTKIFDIQHKNQIIEIELADKI